MCAICWARASGLEWQMASPRSRYVIAGRVACFVHVKVARRGVALPPMMSCISCALTPAWHPLPRLTAPSKLALPTSRRRNTQVAKTLQGFHKRHAIAPAGPVVATLKLYLNTVLGSDTALVQKLDQYVQLWSLLHWWVLARMLKPISPERYWRMRLWVTRSKHGENHND